jgi:hypothetical protein
VFGDTILSDVLKAALAPNFFVNVSAAICTQRVVNGGKSYAQAHSFASKYFADAAFLRLHIGAHGLFL